MSQDFRFDFKNLSKSQWVDELSRHLAQYEKRARQLVRELDLKSRNARAKGLDGLERLSSQLGKARAEFEKRANELIEKESKRLNASLNDFLTYVRSIAKAEVPKRKTRSKKRASSTRSKSVKRNPVRSASATVSTEASAPA